MGKAGFFINRRYLDPQGSPEPRYLTLRTKWPLKVGALDPYTMNHHWKQGSRIDGHLAQEMRSAKVSCPVPSTLKTKSPTPYPHGQFSK